MTATQTNVSMAFSSRYAWDAKWIFSHALRKPLVMGKHRKRRISDEMFFDPDVKQISISIYLRKQEQKAFTYHDQLGCFMIRTD